MPRWAEPRPPLRLPPWIARPGDALPWTGRAHPDLPLETLWRLRTDAAGALAHAGRAIELELDLRWTRSGCTRLFELALATRAKDGASLGRFAWRFPPLSKDTLRPLHRLAGQRWWHLVIEGPQGVVAAVELANTLDLPGLLRRVWDTGPGPRPTGR